MPFQKNILKQKNNTNKKMFKFMRRKEAGFDFSHKKRSLSCKKEKASVSISDGMNASITVEMVICIPIFLYASLCLIWILEMRAIQTVVRSGLHMAGKMFAEDVVEYDMLALPSLERNLISIIGEERIERSVIVGGVEGLDCGASYEIPGTGIYELRVKYRMRIPIPFFTELALECQEHIRIKAWTGYVRESFLGILNQPVVYVTETGLVYHLDANCTYLEPSVKGVDVNTVSSLRSEDGSKYYPCTWCNAAQKTGTVYITDYGTKYHGSQNCSGIKRKAYMVPLEEVKGKVVCSKCGN